MIIQCHECGSQVSTEARACVQCGAPPKLEVFAKQEASQGLDHYVSFIDARYDVTCPTCGNCIVVSAKSLSTKSHIKCQFCHGAGQGNKIAIASIKSQRLREGPIVYRRLTDFYSYYGRVSVADYWLSILPILPILVGFRLIPGPGYPLVFFAILHPLWVKRYHDLGVSGGWVGIQAFAALTSSIASMLLPKALAGQGSYPTFALIWGVSTLVAFVAGIMISFVPGKGKMNRYGPPKAEVKRCWW